MRHWLYKMTMDVMGSAVDFLRPAEPEPFDDSGNPLSIDWDGNARLNLDHPEVQAAIKQHIDQLKNRR
ncbi:hypothetical protein AN401_07020 [Zobellella denitrificans]|uniref:Uncharacterized protein n=1 Tax=Zobellella denitrificans TaxID=347534 RepID=A0A291HNI7_9GAMM|nr:hypothetical protein [Zobellella denitrificans]ATG73638.1 hypothetical protein AN401_07020 [Zobellella denitrificans]